MSDKKDINLRSIGKKVYVLTDTGGWYGQVKDAGEDYFVVLNPRNNREYHVDIFSVRYPEDPILE